MPPTTSSLEQRIIAALQVDGRAPWRRIAAVLGEAERTVARYGTELLDSGAVTIVGLRTQPVSVVLRLACQPGTSRIAAEALAQRPDSTFSYTMTGGADCVAELLFPENRMAEVLATEVPAITGLRSTTAYPVLRYFRTVRGWRSGLLTEAQQQALRPSGTVDSLRPGEDSALTTQDERIIDALAEDGRSSMESLARRSGTSETTARRRTDWLLRNNRVQIRAVVEPRTMGLPIECFLWIRTSPSAVESVGRALARSTAVRYAAAIAGDYQIVANVTLPDTTALYRFTTESPWAAETHSVEPTILLQARKRSGLLLRPRV